jgi:hypothetical protein
VALPLDLHVLSTPPAFVLSQDQTLHQKQTPHTNNKASDEEKESHIPVKQQTTDKNRQKLLSNQRNQTTKPNPPRGT